MDEIAENIKQLLISDLQVDPSEDARVDLQTPLLGRGIGLDSMESLTLALAPERQFDIQIRDEDLTVELFAPIGNLAEYVRHSQSQIDGDAEQIVAESAKREYMEGRRYRRATGLRSCGVCLRERAVAQVLKCLLDLLSRIHDERPVADDGLV